MPPISKHIAQPPACAPKKGAWTPDRAQCDDQKTLRWIVSLNTGGMNTKLHAVTDAKGRPIRFFTSARQVSDYTGAAALLGRLPKAEWLQAERGYDADWFKDALEDKGIKPCIPGRAPRKKTVKYDKRNYKRRNRIEILFGHLKDWRGVATRYNRCPEAFFSAIVLAATVLCWLRNSMGLEPRRKARTIMESRQVAQRKITSTAGPKTWPPKSFGRSKPREQKPNTDAVEARPHEY
jgi:transposase